MGRWGCITEDTSRGLHLQSSVFRMHHGLLSLLIISGSLMIAVGATDYYDDYTGDLLKDEELVKRAWNSQFNGGMGKRGWNSQFSGGPYGCCCKRTASHPRIIKRYGQTWMEQWLQRWHGEERME